MSAWTLKLGLAAAVAAACALAGRALAGREQRRVALLGGLIGALPALRLAMLGQLLPLLQALRAAGHPLLAGVAGHMDEGAMGAREAWALSRAELAREGAMLDCLQAEDLHRLDVLFESLGATGKDGQRLLLDATEAGLSELLVRAKAKADERGKLYTNLGLLLGLAIAVCLL